MPAATESVKVLIVTNHHENHTGNDAQFVAAGIRTIAQENAARRFRAPATEGEKASTPTIEVYDREYTLRQGGVEVQLRSFGRARTDGDTVVYFPDLKVVVVGDLFNGGMPEPDFSAGGSLVDWGPVLARVLELDFDVVVPGDLGWRSASGARRSTAFTRSYPRRSNAAGRLRPGRPVRLKPS